jgi:tetratricopeptide (TPR) repeat protein
MRAQLALGRAALANADRTLAHQAARSIMAHAEQLPAALRAGLGGHLVAHGQRVLAQALDANDPSAVALLKEACATFDAAVQSGSGGERTRLDFAGCQFELALAAMLRGQLATARAAAERAIAMRSAWQQESPDDAENVAELARAETVLAALGDAAAGNAARALVAELEASDRLSPLWRMQIRKLQDVRAPVAGASRT